MMDKSKLYDAVDNFLVEQHIHNPTRLYISCKKSEALYLAELGLMAGMQAG